MATPSPGLVQQLETADEAREFRPRAKATSMELRIVILVEPVVGPCDKMTKGKVVIWRRN